jgi:hypothetical protein
VATVRDPDAAKGDWKWIPLLISRTGDAEDADADLIGIARLN